MATARQFSARLDAGVVDRLERRGARFGLNKSRLAERYIDEGMRMEDHPGIVFRDGPTGRRAGLAAGPDLWEVDMSVVKTTPITERIRTEFRVEFFNLLNHSNFGLPVVAAFSSGAVSPNAGAITYTATTQREIQLALKLMW